MLKKILKKYIVSKREFNELNKTYQDNLLQLSNSVSELSDVTSQFKFEMEATKCEIQQHLITRDNFSDHYLLWREKRVTEIIRHYGPLWFRDKSILELGCGYGDVGINFEGLGASVTYCDARQEHLDVILQNRPSSRVIRADINNEWPFDEEFDLILHMGVLYHLDNMSFSLINALNSCSEMVLETEVCDSSDPDFCLKIEENAEGYDQSVTGQGSRASIAYIEKILGRNNFAGVERLKNEHCDSNFHQYSWEIRETNRWEHGLRAMWFIKTNK